ncbi:MAG: cysteine desulfurase [Deferribacteraceae bacterium]|jgi:cysteine desulfurase family protein|nr:cysteine desulfurase [Deferribacteraceae bacterium]
MIYLDNAATTFPKPQSVIDMVHDTLTHGIGTPGRGTHEAALKAGDRVNIVRRKMQKFFGMLEEYRVAFTYSATDALNTVLKGYLDEGDHVIISTMEHNSVSRPAIRMAQDRFISLDIANTDDYGYIDLDDLKKRFKSNTKLVAISHGSNVAGVVQNIEEIVKLAHEHDVAVLVDAAQTVGVIPINVRALGIDFLAFSGHKGIMGMQGTGGLVIGERIRKLRPFREGGTGFDSESETQPVNWPEAYESGTPNVAGILSMGAGLDFINEVGIENIAKKELAHIDKIYNALNEMDNITIYSPPPGRADRIAVLSFNLDGWDSADVGDVLNLSHGIHLRCGLHCSPLAHKRLGTFPVGTIRVSPGYFTTDDDIEEFIRAVRMLTLTDVPNIGI